MSIIIYECHSIGNTFSSVILDPESFPWLTARLRIICWKAMLHKANSTNFNYQASYSFCEKWLKRLALFFQLIFFSLYSWNDACRQRVLELFSFGEDFSRRDKRLSKEAARSVTRRRDQVTTVYRCWKLSAYEARTKPSALVKWKWWQRACFINNILKANADRPRCASTLVRWHKQQRIISRSGGCT